MARKPGITIIVEIEEGGAMQQGFEELRLWKYHAFADNVKLEVH
jgi:hypothetical protein